MCKKYFNITFNTIKTKKCDFYENLKTDNQMGHGCLQK